MCITFSVKHCHVGSPEGSFIALAVILDALKLVCDEETERFRVTSIDETIPKPD
jgi:hypothetical protein